MSECVGVGLHRGDAKTQRVSCNFDIQFFIPPTYALRQSYGGQSILHSSHLRAETELAPPL